MRVIPAVAAMVAALAAVSPSRVEEVEDLPVGPPPFPGVPRARRRGFSTYVEPNHFSTPNRYAPLGWGMTSEVAAQNHILGAQREARIAASTKRWRDRGRRAGRLGRGPLRGAQF